MPQRLPRSQTNSSSVKVIWGLVVLGSIVAAYLIANVVWPDESVSDPFTYQVQVWNQTTGQPFPNLVIMLQLSDGKPPMSQLTDVNGLVSFKISGGYENGNAVLTIQDTSFTERVELRKQDFPHPIQVEETILQ